MRRVVLVAVLALLEVCCAVPRQAAPATHAAPAGVIQVDLARLLPEPATAGSPEARAELDQMLLVQSGRSAAAAELARADTETSVFRFADAVGAPEVFNAARLPAVAALFEEIHRDDEAAVSRSKDTFARPRPCGLEPRLQPVFACPTSGSYPSGHATFGWSVGLVLADMLPERRSQVLARARQYTWNRVVAGVHYPSDVEAGRISATVIVALLFADAEFRAREHRAAAELRLALGLPALAASR